MQAALRSTRAGCSYSGSSSRSMLEPAWAGGWRALSRVTATATATATVMKGEGKEKGGGGGMALVRGSSSGEVSSAVVREVTSLEGRSERLSQERNAGAISEENAADSEILLLTSPQGRGIFRSESFKRRQIPSINFITDLYTLVEILGKGSYGVVYRAIDKSTGETVAIKSLEKAENATWQLELDLWQTVSGQPNILKLFKAYETEKEVYAVMEFAPGPDLFSEIVERQEKGKQFLEQECLQFLFQMLRAIEACHLSGFAHLDVKPENFIFNENMELLMCDFGAAEPFEKAPYAIDTGKYVEGLDDEIRHLERIRGTASYVSPEIFTHKMFSSRSDVWSVGISFFLMLTGMRPLQSSKETELSIESSIKRQIMEIGDFQNEKFKFGSTHIPFFIVERTRSTDVVQFLKQLLKPRSKDRPSSTEAIRQCKILLQVRGICE